MYLNASLLVKRCLLPDDSRHGFTCVEAVIRGDCSPRFTKVETILDGRCRASSTVLMHTRLHQDLALQWTYKLSEKIFAHAGLELL